RAGSEGQAVSLVCVDEHGLLKGIERLIKRDLEKHIEPGFEPDPNAKPEPIENGRNRRGGRHGQQRQDSGTERRTRSANDGTNTRDARPSRRRRSRPQGSQRA
ncbi:MAG: ATP-dependent RNA helicase RhlE, partial [Halomonadaceae bacterium]|nr:ATP-dependent RNA helicase RhlE [Halomonadaceae bacterium]